MPWRRMTNRSSLAALARRPASVSRVREEGGSMRPAIVAKAPGQKPVQRGVIVEIGGVCFDLGNVHARHALRIAGDRAKKKGPRRISGPPQSPTGGEGNGTTIARQCSIAAELSGTPLAFKANCAAAPAKLACLWRIAHRQEQVCNGVRGGSDGGFGIAFLLPAPVGDDLPRRRSRGTPRPAWIAAVLQDMPEKQALPPTGYRAARARGRGNPGSGNSGSNPMPRSWITACSTPKIVVYGQARPDGVGHQLAHQDRARADLGRGRRSG